ncbi:AmmeMemoRadiSam system protein A/AmmeMemoRadiSam system protein B [Clostridium punense]|uniref:AmmeMemoRadiSam system protein A/AmmeMemoRadiSam system protein B n=1 Tax=Clostridium punense TaxID=1054297 RepID=A0ABS4JZ24_9CLOT|nr:AmmeMemoRadiSam system protein A [Clostridium punense]MBP2020786.1 AmmeMemoRadiSam system protein A/AmmeMemoRadiSam system protein B [Clostridium punense]
MGLTGFYLMPHPPIIIPTIGKGEENKISKTIDSLNTIAKDIKEKSPNTIIIITPHGTMFGDAISLAYEDTLKGDLKKFGEYNTSMEIEVDKKLTSKIYEFAVQKNIPCVMATNELLRQFNSNVEIDHGVFVPLFFINKKFKDYKIVHITYAPLSDLELYKFGMCIDEAARELSMNVVLIASGDLSHRLKKEGPYDYSPYGEVFDKEFLDLLQKGDPLGVMSIDKKTITGAGECGRRSILMLLGALDKNKFTGELMSYEGTFGVGYGVMKFNKIREDETKVDRIEELKKSLYKNKLNEKDPYVRLARESLTNYLTTGRELECIPNYVTNEMKGLKRGVFVSLKKEEELRGCIGTIFPVTDSIAEEILRNAIEAGINDPRFYRVEEQELMDIDFSVDVLTEPEPAIESELDPKKYGVIVRSNGKTGLLLPDLEGVDTVADQLSIALRKANIYSQDYTIEKFEVIRHMEE